MMPRICGSAMWRMVLAQLAPSTAAISKCWRSIASNRAVKSKTISPRRFQVTIPRVAQMPQVASKRQTTANCSRPHPREQLVERALAAQDIEEDD